MHASASTHQHGYVSTTPGTWSSILTYELRYDGFTFASRWPSDVHADANGTFTTKPLQWQGGELAINADTTVAGGSITIAALEDGHKTPESLPFTGNATAATVAWPGGGKFSSLTGKTIQLQVVLAGGARLY